MPDQIINPDTFGGPVPSHALGPEVKATTPHKEGFSSVLEGAPGAAVAVVIVWATKQTHHPMDLATASATIVLATSLSSYVIARIREAVRQIHVAIDRVYLDGPGE